MTPQAPGGQTMKSAKQSLSPDNCNQIDHLRRSFEAWRKSNKPRTRIPMRLWDSAVLVAGQYGLHRTAKALHLDYYTLKQRIEIIEKILDTHYLSRTNTEQNEAVFFL
jgi:hypothetical protein